MIILDAAFDLQLEDSARGDEKYHEKFQSWC